MDYCIVEWGFGINVIDASPIITNSVIRNNGSYGISLYGNSSPTITGSTISGHTYSGIYSSSSTGFNVTNCNLSGNSPYGIYNAKPSVIIIAENNDWGNSSGPNDTSDDRAAGGFYNPGGLGVKVSDGVDYARGGITLSAKRRYERRQNL
ncbi:MAG: right-handed parallel beta-helix repeat-containing protein [Desulfobacteraceae bacterium]|nr:right-handed parallel beta-helix repeat-containing protein [Desulfobacteraceae bacterium]